MIFTKNNKSNMYTNTFKKFFCIFLFSCLETEVKRVYINHQFEVETIDTKNLPKEILEKITVIKEGYDFSKITKEDLDKIPKEILEKYFKEILEKEEENLNDFEKYFRKLFIDESQEKDDGRLLFEILYPCIGEGIENKLKINFSQGNKNILELIKTLENPKEKFILPNKKFTDFEYIENFEKFIKKTIYEEKFNLYIYKKNNEIKILFMRNAHYTTNDSRFNNNLLDSFFLKNITEQKLIEKKKEISYYKDFEQKLKILEGVEITLSRSKKHEIKNLITFPQYYGNNEIANENFENNFFKNDLFILSLYSKNFA